MKLVPNDFLSFYKLFQMWRALIGRLLSTGPEENFMTCFNNELMY